MKDKYGNFEFPELIDNLNKKNFKQFKELVDKHEKELSKFLKEYNVDIVHFRDLDHFVKSLL